MIYDVDHYCEETRQLMARDDTKRLRVLVEQVRAKPGWSVDMTKSSHWRFRGPSGPPYFTGSTPSDKRAVYNAVSALRRLGLNDLRI
jgi:hypothetical protein